MEFRQLTYFTRVVALRSFTKAAAELRIAQPALGQQIRHLEDEFGIPLLIRHSRGVEPTRAGQLLFDRACEMLVQAQKTKDDIFELQGSTQGQVTVGMTPGLGEILAAPLIERCAKIFPKIAINLVQDLSGRLVERVVTEPDVVELALVSHFEISKAKDLQFHPLANERLYLVGSPELIGESQSPIPFAELKSYQLIMLGATVSGRSHGMRRELEEEAARQNIRVDIPHEMQSVAAIKELLEQNIGTAILPFGTVRRRVEDGRLHARLIVEPEVYRQICIISNARKDLSGSAQAVHDLIAELVFETALKGGPVLQPLAIGPILRRRKKESAM